MEDFIQAAEEAFQIQAQGEFSMPDRLSYTRKNGIYNVMPCFTENYISNKLLTTYPGNREKGLPSIQGTVLLSDGETGNMLAMIDGPCLTAFRTGAMGGGVSCKYLAPLDASAVGVVGAGVQGRNQTIAASLVRPIKEVYVFDYLEESCRSFKEEVEKRNPALKVFICQSAEEAAAHGDIIITTTTSPKPVLKDDPELFKGKHIVAIGSFEPDKFELPPAVVKTADEIWVDTMFACEESGDMAVPIAEGFLQKERVTEFCQKVKDGVPDPFTRKQTTLYKSVGLGLFDLVAAARIYDIAVKNGIGLSVEI